MPTARSWPERRAGLVAAVADVGHLLWFRRATVRRPRAAALALAGLGAATVAAATLPDLVPAPAGRGDLARLLAPALAAVVLAVVSGAVASGGGRELLARDPAAVYPISPLTDHLGALLLAPLSAGWLIQAWALLGLVAAAAGAAGAPVALAWLMAVTALAQAIGWAAEYLRRRRVLAWLALPFAGLGVAPAPLVAAAIGTGSPAAQALAGAALLVATVLLVAVGGALAVVTAGRMPRDEARQETATHAARPLPRSDLALLRRTDRASVWRSVPLRRGTVLLALAPGAVALAGGLAWSSLVLLPGLVASGCVLLFGVNLWCLDGRGMLWRESLPVAPHSVLLARALVLTEVLLGAGTATLALGALRAGRPTAAEALAVVLALLVVVAQSVSAALRWSLAHPYAVDLRSARATPAPPLAMVGYSLRLAVATTLSGLLLAGFAGVGRVDLVALGAALLLAVAAVRIGRAARRWTDPVRRASVVTVVAA